MKIYLAGKMGGLSTEEANGWRKTVKNVLDMHDIEVINPVDYYNFDNYSKLKATDKEILDFDILAIDNCDMILVNLNYENSIGTAIEMFHAVYHCKKPVIAFANDDNFQHQHEWVRANTTKCFNTQGEAIDFIVSFYKPIFK